jgi:hypothetical protein
LREILAELTLASSAESDGDWRPFERPMSAQQNCGAFGTTSRPKRD